MSTEPIAGGTFPTCPERWEVWPLTFGRARLYLLRGAIEVLDSW